MSARHKPGAWSTIRSVPKLHSPAARCAIPTIGGRKEDGRMTELMCELGGTVRAAIGGWAPTVRLVIVLVVITICYLVVVSAS